MISPEELVGEEWAAWYRLTPVERWRESEKLWNVYFHLGGSLDSQPDTQSPFFDPSSPQGRIPVHLRRTRPLLKFAATGDKPLLERALLEEEQKERDADRRYWASLKKELEKLRHARVSPAKR